MGPITSIVSLMVYILRGSQSHSLVPSLPPYHPEEESFEEQEERADKHVTSHTNISSLPNEAVMPLSRSMEADFLQFQDLIK